MDKSKSEMITIYLPLNPDCRDYSRKIILIIALQRLSHEITVKPLMEVIEIYSFACIQIRLIIKLYNNLLSFVAGNCCS